MMFAITTVGAFLALGMIACAPISATEFIDHSQSLGTSTATTRRRTWIAASTIMALGVILLIICQVAAS